MPRPSRFLAIGPLCVLNLALASLGCTADDTTPTDDEIGDTTSGDTTSSTDDASTGETMTNGEAPTTETDTGSLCGDGVVDPGEECDDGNTITNDGCSETCEISACGLEWTWSETITSGTPGGFGVVVDAMGGVYATGDDVDGNIWVARWNADGTLDWEQTYGPGYGSDLVLGAQGDLFVVGVQTNTDDDLWFARLTSVDGSEVWSQVIDSTLGDDVGNGIALDPGGSPVVVGRTRIGDGDDDVWVSKRSADDGSETWVSLWGGTGDGMFSTDRGGPVTITDDGSIWVGAREHVAFDIQEATLLAFDPAGALVDSWQPQAIASAHQHESYALTNDGTNVYYLIAKFAFPYRSWLYKLDGSGTELWSKTEADWVVVGSDWQIDGLDVDDQGNLLVGGEFANEELGEGITWGEAWVAKLDGNGDVVCRSSHMVDDGDIVPPSLDVFAAGGSSGGIALTGRVSDTPDDSLWTGFFRL